MSRMEKFKACWILKIKMMRVLVEIICTGKSNTSRELKAKSGKGSLLMNFCLVMISVSAMTLKRMETLVYSVRTL